MNKKSIPVARAPMFEGLDYRPSPIGVLSLRRRLSQDGKDVYEIKLDDGYLMSSHFTVGEIDHRLATPRPGHGPATIARVNGDSRLGAAPSPTDERTMG